MNIQQRAKIWLNVLVAYLKTFCGVHCSVLDPKKTVEEILKGKSLIRFGDGEFGIYRCHDIHYQPWSEKLQKEFEAIKNDFESAAANCPYLLSVPKKYMQCSGIELGRKRVLVSSWAESRLFFKRNFNLQLEYGDSFLFEKKNRKIYSKIWQNKNDQRCILFVHNNKRCADDFRYTYNRKVIHIPCPSYDAYSVIVELLDQIKTVIQKNNLNSNSVQIVISAGPAGKALVYRLSKYGYQCIDAGHCWDDPLES